MLCSKGFSYIRKRPCSKSPYNALQTLEYWIRHVCLQIMSLVMQGFFIFRLAVISYVRNISNQKGLKMLLFMSWCNIFLFCLFRCYALSPFGDKIPTKYFNQFWTNPYLILQPGNYFLPLSHHMDILKGFFFNFKPWAPNGPRSQW